MERNELVRAPGYEKTLEISGATCAYEPMYDFHAAEGRFITREDLAAEQPRWWSWARRGASRSSAAARPWASGSAIGGGIYTVVGVMERKDFYWNTANETTWSG